MKYLKLFENFNTDTNVKLEIKKELESQYNKGKDVYNALFKDGGKDAINVRIKQMDNQQEALKDLDLNKISQGSIKLSDKTSDRYNVGRVMIKLDNEAFSSAFYRTMDGKDTNFDSWYSKNNIEGVLDIISDFYNG
jgi:hypothetical protein